MPNWASLAEARTDLRRFVNDGPLDRPVKMKQAIGLVDGVNKIFHTWDDRLVPNSLLVYVNESPLTSGVAVEDTAIGRFTIDPAPTAQSKVRVQYYFQYFLDEELEEALKMAANEIRETDDVTLVEVGLKLAALHYAGHFSYMKQAMRWAQRMSSRFILEEEPLDNESLVRSNMFTSIAKTLRDTGDELRDNFYKRHGRRNAPAFNILKPSIRPVGPRR